MENDNVKLKMSGLDKILGYVSFSIIYPSSTINLAVK